jgi:hypothetical protein
MKDPCTHSSPRVWYKHSSHLRGENQASLCSALYSWSLNLAKHQAIFWHHCRGTSRRIAHKKVFITNLCKRLSLGRLHLREFHLFLFRFAKYFILVLLLYCISFYFQFCITFIFGLHFIFVLHFYLLFVISVALVVAWFYFQFSF